VNRNEPAALAAADTLSERAAAWIEADILSGALTPGGRLGIAGTAARYGVGATPVREALSRLAARGLVDAIGQRGFRVKAISREDLADIIRIRTLVEREALRLSLETGGGAWEGEIVATLHRLKRYIRANPRGFGEGQPEFDALHKSFHTALIAACGSPRLLAAHSDLYDQTYRYRRLMMAKFADPEEFVRAHEGLAQLTIDRARSAASAALEVHIASTLILVYPETSGIAV
jgi:GntR family transcriptional regulator, carbon starvation induced regulator